MGQRIAGITLCLLLAAATAGGEIYRWIDENGSVTFKDAPPPPSKKEVRKVKVYREADFDPTPPASVHPTGRPERKAAVAATTEPRETQRFSGTVDIYLTSWCGYCKQAVKYMTSRGIPFMSYDIEKDPAAKQRYKELGGRGVPLIIIGSNKMSGFSPDVLEYYLNNSR